MFKQLIEDYRHIWREPVFYLVAVFVAFLMLIHILGEAHAELLEFHRELIRSGQWWRLYSGNFVHFGLYHTGMNCAGFAALVLVLFRDQPLRVLLLATVLIPAGVGLGLYWTDLEIYRGFSGSNYGLLALGLLLGLHHNLRLYALALLILTGKIVSEQLPGYDVDYLRDKIGVAVAVQSHLSGFCAGVVMGVGTLVWSRVRKKAAP